MRFEVVVAVMPRQEISDPQGQTIQRALPTIGFEGISGVRVGKRIEFLIDAADEATARRIVDEACRAFLTNPVIEDYHAEVLLPERTG